MTANQILELARGEIGTVGEGAYRNLVKYNTEYYGSAVSGSAYAWCVVFVWWCFKHAGASSLFYGGGKTASCTTLNTYHRAQGQAITNGNYQPGDIIFFNFSGGTTTVHVGICESWDGSYITTIDGNTSSSNEANGGTVNRRRRARSFIVAAYRPAYEPEIELELELEEDDDMTRDEVLAIIAEYEAAKAIEPPSSWSQTERTWAESEGIITGDQNGNMMYQSPCTREMMVVFLYRLWNKVKSYVDNKLGS